MDLILKIAADIAENSAIMADKYQGIEIRLHEIYERTQFVPGVVHSLNLIGVCTLSAVGESTNLNPFASGFASQAFVTYLVL